MSPSAVESCPRRGTFWDRGIKGGSSRLPLGEERANILLLACCYQEGSNPRSRYRVLLSSLASSPAWRGYKLRLPVRPSELMAPATACFCHQIGLHSGDDAHPSSPAKET